MSFFSDLLWLNGEILPSSEAKLSFEDRGFQFGDGVYEVIRLYDGKPFALLPHLERLWRSAVEIQLTPPLTTNALALEVQRLIDHVETPHDACIYMQLTRGPAPRGHMFPEVAEPTLLFYVMSAPPIPAPTAGEGAKLMTVPDERWRRCWVKAIALLPNVLAKNTAVAAGCDEAVFVENGYVTECSTSNLFAVVNGKLVTPPIGTKVLPGVTRAVVIELAEEMGIEVDERAIREDEAPRAEELFITSTTREIGWVSRWNDIYIGRGRCGGITARLQSALKERIARETEAGVSALSIAG